MFYRWNGCGVPPHVARCAIPFKAPIQGSDPEDGRYVSRAGGGWPTFAFLQRWGGERRTPANFVVREDQVIAWATREINQWDEIKISHQNEGTTFARNAKVDHLWPKNVFTRPLS